MSFNIVTKRFARAVAIYALAMVTSSCTKDIPPPPTAPSSNGGNTTTPGMLSFSSTATKGWSSITVNVDGRLIGTLTSYVHNDRQPLRQDLTSPAFDSFTNSQVKTLLLLASDVRKSTPNIGEEQAKRVADQIGALSNRCGLASQALLKRAVSRTTSGLELRQIKDITKDLLKRANTKREREAASIVYHLAVAAAFARHGLDISTRPIRERATLYRKLAQAFYGHAIGHVFQQAEHAIDNLPQI